MKHSLIIPTVNQTALLETCVKSIFKHETNREKYEIIVVDDGSDEKIQSWVGSFCRQHNLKFHLEPVNQGFSHTVNLGLKIADGEYLTLVNNDVEFIKPVLDILADCFETKKEVGVVGAKLLFPTDDLNKAKVQHAGVVRIPSATLSGGSFIHVNKHVPRNTPSVNQSKYYPSVTGAFYAIRREAYDAVGPWNESYFLSCEDTEYSLRVWQKKWHVLYNHLIEATHHEGHTRGANDLAKKRISIDWFIKERETIPKFTKDLSKFHLKEIDNEIRRLNHGSVVKIPTIPRVPDRDVARKVKNIVVAPKAQPLAPVQRLKKLEVGCGEYQQPGYVHLDVRQLKGIDVVCDFGKERLPFQNNEFEEILSNHSIEHVSWRKVGHVIAEWHRVLQPGGRVFFRTPDLRFICETYLAGKTTPEHPNDEGFVTGTYGQKVTPAWWANIKLFAGQDYDGNTHYFAFDFDMAKSLLEKYGFERVTRLDVDPKFSPGELQIEAFKPQAMEKTAQVSDPVSRVLIRRKGALGDVVMMTPIVRRLREVLGNEATIDVATNSGSIFLNNPFVNNVLPGNAAVDGYTRVIDLDMAYERTPERHIIESFSEVAFNEYEGTEFDKRTDIFFTENDKNIVIGKLTELGLWDDNHLRRLTIVHAGVTWKNRTWPQERWDHTIRGVVANGRHVIVIGRGGDFSFKGPGVTSLINLFTIQQIAFLISVADTFVSNDSGMLHIAGTTDTKIVGIFTSAKGEYRMPFRNGVYGHNCHIVRSPVECYGCLHKETPPVVFVGCKRGDYKCLADVTPEMMVEVVQ